MKSFAIEQPVFRSIKVSLAYAREYRANTPTPSHGEEEVESGDAWFNTGDLMQTVDVGFTMGYPLRSDRVGDTFRWKSENVSRTNGEILNGFDQIEFCNVYGVESLAHGRAGMVAVT